MLTITTGAMRQLPLYQSRKKVWALKIAAIEIMQDGRAKITPTDDGFAPFETGSPYNTLFNGDESDLGYYVQYSDGCVSWSPSRAFEEGYTLIA